ncbi:Nuclear elongation and deformation protein 1 [Smittium mucronatum]|uniref:Nuclear elongation and deformation protein 1 n=1 Tax=Smittium mucronatum TaxID=133383 RepID=A0A1R0H531_9FUNG|nr:Nuclear elongation and deformation protein 1 [Smittium mucronatum]
MQYVGKVLSSVSDFYRELNPATLSGAVDIIVVKDKDGNFSCSPFHVRFGKFQLLRPSDKTVEITVNDKKADFYMKLGEEGEAFFVLETENDIPSDIMTSPIHSPTIYSPDLDAVDNLDLPDSNHLILDSLNTEQNESSESYILERTKKNLEKLDSYKIIESCRDNTPIENINITFQDDSQIKTKKYNHRRPLSVSSDSRYELSATNNSLDLANPSVTGSLHSEWDWGVSIPDSKMSEPPVTVQIEPPEDGLSINPDASKNISSETKIVFDDVKSFIFSKNPSPLKISLCGTDELSKAVNKEERKMFFDSKQVLDFDFSSDLFDLLQNQDAVFLVNGNYYMWKDISSAIFCYLILGKISDNLKISPIAIDNPSHESLELSSFSDIASKSQSAIPTSNDSNDKIESNADNNISLPLDSGLSKNSEAQNTSPDSSSKWRWWRSSTSRQESDSTDLILNKSKSFNIDSKSMIESSDVSSLSESQIETTQSTKYEKPRNYAKTLRLTHEQLKSLDLSLGENKVLFRVKSGKGYCEASIFLYPHDVQIVISDIDGTITKSDALGHLFNMVGRDWTHTGVAKLFTDIHKNQYEFLYLTSRAIGQADTTREYLRNVKQGSYKLPRGPLLLSPDRLFASFHREIIMKRPQDFKMACLRDIKNLFQNDTPFYAGFGNRITDAMSYRSVNVPVSRICTIDPSGVIKLELLSGYKSSYTKMGDLVDLMFPPITAKLDPNYNDFEYWRPSLPDIEKELSLIEVKSEVNNTPKSDNIESQKKGHETTIEFQEHKVRRAYSVYADNEYSAHKNRTSSVKTISTSRTGIGITYEQNEYDSRLNFPRIESLDNDLTQIYEKKDIHFHVSEKITSTHDSESSYSSIVRKKSREFFTYPNIEYSIPQHQFENLTDPLLDNTLSSEIPLSEVQPTWTPTKVKSIEVSRSSSLRETRYSDDNKWTGTFDSINDFQSKDHPSLTLNRLSSIINVGSNVVDENFSNHISDHLLTNSKLEIKSGRHSYNNHDSNSGSDSQCSIKSDSINKIGSMNANNIDLIPENNFAVDSIVGSDNGEYDLGNKEFADDDDFDDEDDVDDAMSSLSGEIDLNDFPYL